MALFDVMFEFSDNQPVAATAQSTDVLNWGDTDLEMGAGTPIWLNIQVQVAASAGTSLTCDLLSTDGDTDIDDGTEGTHYIKLWSSGAVPQASLTAGHWICRIPLDVNADEFQYMGIQYTASGTLTGCTVNAWLDHGPQSSYDTQVATSNI